MPAGAFTLAGSPVPLGGDISDLNTKLGLVPAAGDTIAIFNSTANDWNTAVTWSGKSSTWTCALPVAAGAGFLYYNAAATPNTWVSNFTVQ